MAASMAGDTICTSGTLHKTNQLDSKLRLLTSELNFCEMALVKNAVCNGTVWYHQDSKKISVLLCLLLLPESPSSLFDFFRLFQGSDFLKSDFFKAVCGNLSLPESKWNASKKEK